MSSSNGLSVFKPLPVSSWLLKHPHYSYQYKTRPVQTTTAKDLSSFTLIGHTYRLTDRIYKDNSRKSRVKDKVVPQENFPYLSPWIGNSIDRYYKLKLYQLRQYDRDSSIIEQKRQPYYSSRPCSAGSRPHPVKVTSVATVVANSSSRRKPSATSSTAAVENKGQCLKRVKSAVELLRRT